MKRFGLRSATVAVSLTLLLPMWIGPCVGQAQPDGESRPVHGAAAVDNGSATDKAATDKASTADANTADANTAEKQLIDELVERRIVLLQGEIDDRAAEHAIAALRYLDAVEPGKDIYLYINSPGGLVSSALEIYDTMQQLESEVATVNFKLAASMGAFLLAAGTRGKRFALANSYAIVHQPFVTSKSGQAADLEAIAAIVRIRRQLNQVFAQHTGQPLEKIERDTQRDYLMSAQEAKNYGLVDQIIESLSDLP